MCDNQVRLLGRDDRRISAQVQRGCFVQCESGECMTGRFTPGPCDRCGRSRPSAGQTSGRRGVVLPPHLARSKIVCGRSTNHQRDRLLKIGESPRSTINSTPWRWQSPDVSFVSLRLGVPTAPASTNPSFAAVSGKSGGTGEWSRRDACPGPVEAPGRTKGEEDRQGGEQPGSRGRDLDGDDIAT
jgi:hypothetical protein